MFQYFKAKKKAKEIEKLSKKFPLWNYGVRKYGYPCWESYVLHMRLFTAQEIKLIHEVILKKGNFLLSFSISLAFFLALKY